MSVGWRSNVLRVGGCVGWCDGSCASIFLYRLSTSPRIMCKIRYVLANLRVFTRRVHFLSKSSVAQKLNIRFYTYDGALPRRDGGGDVESKAWNTNRTVHMFVLSFVRSKA
jgi:hypothetical protein